MDVNRAVEIFTGHGFESAAQVHATYSMSHHGVEVRVEVLDYGLAAANVRYMATAWQPEVPVEDRVLNEKGLSIGNAAETVDEALAGPHWWIFTRDDER